MKKMHRVLVVAAGLGVATLAGTASAQFSKAEDAVKYRQSGFTVIANHMGRLAAMAKGEQAFNAEAAKVSANLINDTMKHQWAAFPSGSDGDGAKLKADPWKRADEFKKLQEKSMAETAKLTESTGSLDALRPQVGATGASCKACHDEFRRI